ncbi:MAG: hypothetical protein N0C81_15635 [Candidatus Thiodiazotropha lotti]|uniref:Uncharacterized protein n=1 Tax=Candidatus Thiodiazotropha lotti TaxID=2792787 RepID=A0A9E4K0M9_9GAMM|nr:hypothetical protein [Candidatus Thiodiazotropha lotti]MCG7937452.1 hypothetical protein [Candidatus Thiodiazotropha lotti]MCG8003997.1 hypothetical protein [Candidatus Thiodiazotropha lotti]MCG8009057.1 hypothetical protein [Candidatus Thiodiazotropha lotti]MCW4187618.1 hypothetical protein [Candidatus Thiodiazotropha lotti]
MDDNIITAIEAINSSTLSRGDNSLEIGYGASLTDISNFENSLSNAQNKTMDVPRSEGPSNTEKAISKPLDYINQEAEKIVNYAKSAVESGNELTPSEIVMLTARSHEFMFHCQLTSNIANRTSDGLQQLFRQQS